MKILKDDPNYKFEEYSGHLIASHVNNVLDKSLDNLIIIFELHDFPNHGYIVGLDDSKSSGRRVSYPHNLQDAKDYIDWKVEVSKKQIIIQPSNHKKAKRNILLSPEYDLRVTKGQLPTIDVAGYLFYVDMRMDKLRPKDDFLSKGISFKEIDDHFSEELNAYIIPYDPIKHEFSELDYENLLSIPKDLLAIQFPFQKKLDPIGWNRQNGWDILDDVKAKDLIPHFKAKIIPWEKTYIKDIIKDNKEFQKQKQQQENPAAKPEIKKSRGKRI